MPLPPLVSKLLHQGKLIAGAIGCCLLLTMTTGHAAGAEISVQGATTVATGLMIPHESEIEAASGQMINILPSSTTRGLAALVAGEADIAMLAEPLEDVEKKALEKAPGSFDPTKFVGYHVGDAQSQIIINPANTVTTLTKEQVAGLFSGAIKNWKEVGGPDMEVLAVTEPTSSQHALISKIYGFTFGPDVREVQNASQTATIVAQAPNAISYLSTAHQVPERDRIKVVETGVSVPLSLYVAIRKDASDAVRKVVQAAIAVGTM